jgi:sterol desaturase/sphingolipid hydroxylase (fatty acid hydroxylase superfamily)
VLWALFYQRRAALVHRVHSGKVTEVLPLRVPEHKAAADREMNDVLTFVVTQLTKAATAVAQPDSYLYWPYLVSALLLALMVIGVAGSALDRQPWRDRVRQHFDIKLWWHRSARADYQLYFANAIVVPAIFAVVTFGDAQFGKALSQALGTPHVAEVGDLGSSSIAARLMFTILFFIAYDFGRFVAHSLLHDVPLLWEFHKVHHSAETLNPMTTFRAHPIDLLVMIWIPVLITGTVTWLFNQIVAVPVTFYAYLGVHVLLFASNLLGTLRHTHVWLSYGRLLNKWFISPAQHQLHHSCEPHHLGCNRGFELAVWDRLYGTLYVPSTRETFRIGLGDGTDGRWHSLTRMYFWPFANAFRHIVADVLHRSPGTSSPLSTPRSKE